MKKYKINRDKKSFKVPSDDEIYKYKNFERLTTMYNDVTKRPKTPIYKNRKLFLLLILIALLAYVLSTLE